MFNPYQALNSKYVLPKGERFRLNRRPSLAQGIQFYLVPQAFTGNVVDLVKPRQPATPGIWLGNPLGRTLSNATFANAATTDLACGGGPFTVACFLYLTAALGSGEYYEPVGRDSYTNESTNSGWQITLRASNDPTPNKAGFVIFNNNSATNYQTATTYSTTSLTGGYYSLAGESDGVVAQGKFLYVNGKLECTAGNPVNTIAATTSAAMTLGVRATGSASLSKCQLLMVGVWNRRLNAEEVADLHNNPFQLAESVRSSRVFLPLPPVAAAGTLKSRKTKEAKEPRPWLVW